MNHVVDKAFDGIVVTDVNVIQIDGEVDVVPHIVVILHMVIKSLGFAFKLMAGYTTYETECLLVLFYMILYRGTTFVLVLKFQKTAFGSVI